ncbi:hypothetical protein BZA05DRAFT_445119 [Tricharina praecox]|uniref:uncharacterized protein n=1 Tax=Tricharina praecox TaxID=43433 RepID=UPI0022202E38|nr:uncharacterized protein BZA05DRAFT_445119 [Tricharina praecox]KAI5851956.1 hypothetical protein BZA05DRAFT_445119 [Tricharina praecox]
MTENTHNGHSPPNPDHSATFMPFPFDEDTNPREISSVDTIADIDVLSFQGSHTREVVVGIPNWRRPPPGLVRRYTSLLLGSPRQPSYGTDDALNLLHPLLEELPTTSSQDFPTLSSSDALDDISVNIARYHEFQSPPFPPLSDQESRDEDSARTSSSTAVAHEFRFPLLPLRQDEEDPDKDSELHSATSTPNRAIDFLRLLPSLREEDLNRGYTGASNTVDIVFEFSSPPFSPLQEDEEENEDLGSLPASLHNANSPPMFATLRGRLTASASTALQFPNRDGNIVNRSAGHVAPPDYVPPAEGNRRVFLGMHMHIPAFHLDPRRSPAAADPREVTIDPRDSIYHKHRIYPDYNTMIKSQPTAQNSPIGGSCGFAAENYPGDAHGGYFRQEIRFGHHPDHPGAIVNFRHPGPPGWRRQEGRRVRDGRDTNHDEENDEGQPPGAPGCMIEEDESNAREVYDADGRFTGGGQANGNVTETSTISTIFEIAQPKLRGILKVPAMLANPKTLGRKVSFRTPLEDIFIIPMTPVPMTTSPNILPPFKWKKSLDSRVDQSFPGSKNAFRTSIGDRRTAENTFTGSKITKSMNGPATATDTFTNTGYKKSCSPQKFSGMHPKVIKELQKLLYNPAAVNPLYDRTVDPNALQEALESNKRLKEERIKGPAVEHWGPESSGTSQSIRWACGSC